MVGGADADRRLGVDRGRPLFVQRSAWRTTSASPRDALPHLASDSPPAHAHAFPHAQRDADSDGYVHAHRDSYAHADGNPSPPDTHTNLDLYANTLSNGAP